MKKAHAFILLAVGSFAASVASFGLPSEQGDFNEARLQSGRSLYEEKRYLEAIDQFRVAAFGFLDQPAPLSSCLARLVLAQTAAGRPADADATILRFLEIERRFPSYPLQGLEPERQADFRTVLLRRMPEATLLGVPSLAGLVETEEQKIAKLPPAQRRKALEAASRRDPDAVAWPLALGRDAMDRSDWKDAERWAGKALSMQPANAEALALRARARMMRGDVAQARTDLAGISPAELAKRPELYADVFVCLVDAGDWNGAEEAAKRIPAGLSGRADVSKAQQKLAAGIERRAAQAPKTAQAPKAAPPPAGPAASQPAASQPAPAQRAAAAPPARTSEAAAIAARSRDALAESGRLVLAGKAVEARTTLAGALRSDPSNRDLRLALLEAACLSRSYRDGAEQVALVAPFSDTEGPSMFYAAVVLFETGKADEARGYLTRALPRVSGPLVDEYSTKILGR